MKLNLLLVLFLSIFCSMNMVLGSDDPDDDKTVDSPDDPDDDEPTSTPNNLSPTSEPNSSPNAAPTGGPASVGNTPTSGPAGNSPTSGPASVGNNPTSGPAGNSPTSGPANVGNNPTSGPAGNSPTSGPASVGNSPTSGPAGNSPSLPTSGPNSNPSGNSPTTGPSTSACTDSPLRMKIVINGRNRRRGCDWVARLNTQKRCSLDTVASHCSIACAKYGGNCNVDSQARFKTQRPDGKNIMRSCVWVRNNPNYRCTFPGVTKTCRSTC